MNHKKCKLDPAVKLNGFGYLCESSQKEIFYGCLKCPIRFYSVEELKDHVNLQYSSMNHVNLQDSRLKLQDLPVEMIRKIFGYLEPDNLAAVSVTCKEYKKIAENVFKQNYNKSAILQSKISSTKPITYFDYQHSYLSFDIRFRSAISNIDVGLRDPKSLLSALKFINENCCKRLRSLRLECNRLATLNTYHSRLLAEQTKSVEILQVVNIGNIQYLLRRCNNLQTLHIGTKEGITWKHDWLKDLKIASLKTFILNEKGRIARIDLTNFLQNNRQVENILCNNIYAIRSILSSDAQLRYLGISISTHDLESIWSDLEAASRQNKIECFEIVLWTFRETLPHNSLIRGLHLGLFTHSDLHLFNKVSVQLNMRRLCVEVFLDFMSEKEFDRFVNIIIKKFPNLYELRLGISGSPIYLESLCKLISRLKHIKRIYITGYRRPKFTERESENFNMVRPHIENASCVNVYLNCFLPKCINLSQNDLVTISSNYQNCFLCNIQSINVDFEPKDLLCS